MSNYCIKCKYYKLNRFYKFLINLGFDYFYFDGYCDHIDNKKVDNITGRRIRYIWKNIEYARDSLCKGEKFRDKNV